MNISKKIISIVLAIILILSLTSCKKEKPSENSFPYSYSMKEIFEDNGDEKIVDIAMLGSHDSFSNKITKDSLLDVDGTPSYMGFKILGGLMERICKAQEEDAYTQLSYGVRYFDVRISNVDGEYYTKHNKLSAPLEEYITDVIKYLLENPGEVVVFDMQHVFLGEKTKTEFFSALYNILYDNTSLFDFVNYKTVGEDAIKLEDLTYDKATKNGIKSGVVVLFEGEPEDQLYLNKFYLRSENIRSEWHDKNKEEEMFEGIDNEYKYLSENLEKYSGKLRVNQAQMTAQMNLSVLTADLVKYANEFNYKQLERESFYSYLSVMPIFMVDNATTKAHNFNYKVMEIIAKFNMELDNAKH